METRQPGLRSVAGHGLPADDCGVGAVGVLGAVAGNQGRAAEGWQRSCELPHCW